MKLLMELLAKRGELSQSHKRKSMVHFSLCEIIQIQKAKQFDESIVIIDPNRQFKKGCYKKHIIDQNILK